MAKHNFESTKVGFIGGGNMASAIGAGLIRKGTYDINKLFFNVNHLLT